MDHAEARELLDVAAVEPGGLDRLMAGDTPTATALAGHLAGCPSCMEELTRLRRSSTILRDLIATEPPSELRGQTLAFVAAVGRPRGRTDAPPPDLRETANVRVVEMSSASEGRRRAPGRTRHALLAAAAAVILATAGLSGFAVSVMNDASVRQASLELEGLTEVAQWTARLDAQPDVRHVVLTAQEGGTAAEVGTLIFSSAARQIVVVADGLPQPLSGHEYRCWVEVGGSRQRLGKMYVSGPLAYWVGDAPVLADVPAGSVFGVSLADSNAPGGASPTILSGTLQTS